MLDQSFSPENFNTIFEIENRKGRINRNYFSTKFSKLSEQLSEKRKELKKISDKDLPNYITLKNEMENLIKEKESTLKEDLTESSKIVNQSTFNFKLQSFIDFESQKKIYTIAKDGPSFFAIKQLQFNISRSFKVKQANRHQITKQVYNILNDDLPKYIVRTDIEGFYESVPQAKLISLVFENQLLNPKSKSLIMNILYQYNLMTDQLRLNKNERKGIPRGIGISAYLSELYMRDIDTRIREMKSLTFYGRYVDDIIMVFSPTNEEEQEGHYLKLVENIVNNENLKLKRITKDKYIDSLFSTLTSTGVSTEVMRIQRLKKIISKAVFEDKCILPYIDNLFLELNMSNTTDLNLTRQIINERINELNENKTYQLDIYSSKQKKEIEITFLGYKFKLLDRKLEGVYLSENKIQKYTSRIKLSISHYLDTEKYNKKNARMMLIHRINYLTKNVRLLKPKKGIVGIYYSNSLLSSESKCLIKLNEILNENIDNLLPKSNYEILNNILKKFCFRKGFIEKKFFNIASQKKTFHTPFRPKASRTRPQNNFEKITSIWR